MAAAVAATALAVPAAAGGATIPVNTFEDQIVTDPAHCAFHEAVVAADNDAPQAGCPAGAGADTITLPGGTYPITLGGTNVSTDVGFVSTGPGPAVIDGAGDHFMFFIAGPARVTMFGLTIKDGFSNAGGAIRVDSTAILELRNTTLLDNRAVSGGSGVGGAIYNTGTATLFGVTAVGNSSDGDGGAIYDQGSMTAYNSTLSGNRADGSGGGLFDASLFPTALRSTTLSANAADQNADGSGDGGGLAANGTGLTTLQASIVAGNRDASPASQAPDCANSPFAAGFNIIGNTAGCAYSPGIDEAHNVDPGLLPLADNGGPTLTHALTASSPALNRIHTSLVCPLLDQRGLVRDQMQCDSGAYERAVCRDIVINRVGSADDDALNGTEGADAFLLGAGDDTATGLGGDDAFCGEAGDDSLTGGAGNDLFDADLGNDTIVGGPGRDFARAGPGRDDIFGEAGNDRLDGDFGGDTIRGGAGKDRLRGAKGKDVLRGQAGRDKLFGGKGRDLLNAGSGRREKCVGGSGRDRARGCEKRSGVP